MRTLSRARYWRWVGGLVDQVRGVCPYAVVEDSRDRAFIPIPSEYLNVNRKYNEDVTCVLRDFALVEEDSMFMNTSSSSLDGCGTAALNF